MEMRVQVFVSIQGGKWNGRVGGPPPEVVGAVRSSGLDHKVGLSGVTIEGALPEVFACVQQCHQAVADVGGGMDSVVKVRQAGNGSAPDRAP